MLYAIIAKDREGSLEFRRRVREKHLERLEVLRAEGRLILAGPHPAIDSDDPGPAGFTGSLIVAEFPDLATAESWAAEDPYVTDGVFVEYLVKPFKKVMP